MPSSPPKEKGRRHTNECRFQARVPPDAYAILTGPLKGKGSRALTEMAYKYREENGHSVIAMEEEIMRQEEVVLREMHKLQNLRHLTEGMRVIHPTSPPTTPPSPAPPAPPTNGNGPNGGALPAAIEKELRAFYRAQARAHIPRAERHQNLLTKCADLLQREKDLRTRFPSPDALLTEFAKRIL